MTIKIKLLLSFTIIVAMMLIFGIYSLDRQKAVGLQVAFMRQGSMQEVVATARLGAALHNSYGAVQEIMEEALRARLLDEIGSTVVPPNGEIKRARQVIETSLVSAQAHLDEIAAATLASVQLAGGFDDAVEEAEKEELAVWQTKMRAAMDEYQRAVLAMLERYDSGQLAGAVEVLEMAVEDVYRQRLIGLLDGFTADAVSELDEESAEIIATVGTIRLALGWTLVIVIGTAIAITLLLAKNISVPLVRLARAADRIRRGEPVERHEHPADDEIGRLTRVFFDMVATEKRVRNALELAHNQLELHNEVLEKTVSQRTKELTATNSSLKREIEEHLRTEAKLGYSLKEKETLLKEIHHRVKNNLQVITSLLRLQSGQVKDVESQGLLLDSEMRIRSMAMVHEKLYQSNNLDAIDLGGYIQSLGTYLMQTYNSANVRLQMHTEPIMVSLDTAIPCGLVLSELVTNVLKHAFDPEGGGQLTIRLAIGPDNMVVLQVADDGKGLPLDFDPAQSDSLGWQLLESLGQQLEAQIETASENGTTISLRFPPG